MTPRHGVRRIVPLLLGWEELPKSVSVHGAPYEERLREPVPAVLLECDGGWLLLDTGFNTALIRDPALRRRFYGSPNYRPILPGPGEPLEEALDAAGIPMDAIHAVAVSHLHADHAGGLKHFAGRVPVHVQREELSYGLSGQPEVERHSIFRVDFDDPRIDWRQADGDTEIAPGVTAVLTAGHTPGTRVSSSTSWTAAVSCSPSTPPISPRTSSTSARSAPPSVSTRSARWSPSAVSRASPQNAATNSSPVMTPWSGRS